MEENRCVICGADIPEGRQICPNCEHIHILERDHGDIVYSSCKYEGIKHKKPPCAHHCHTGCKYMLMMFEDGRSMFLGEDFYD